MILSRRVQKLSGRLKTNETDCRDGQNYPAVQIKSASMMKEILPPSLSYHLVQEKVAVTFDWCLTPVYNPGEAFPLERFKLILQLNENAGGVFRVIGQQHKWVYRQRNKFRAGGTCFQSVF